MPPSPGRNDPCPCGSGRKFKQCCLGKGGTDHSTRVRLRRAEGRIVDAVFGFALERFGRDFFLYAWEDFYTGRPPEGEIHEAPEFEQMFIPWFVFGFVADGDVPDDWPDVSLARYWQMMTRPALDAVEAAFLTAACASPLSVCVVEAADPGRSLDLRDVFTNRRFRALEQSASRILRPGDLHFTSIVTVGGDSIMVGGSPQVVPPDWHVHIIDFRDQVLGRRRLKRRDLAASQFVIRDLYFYVAEALRNPAPPKLQNTDGEDLELTTIVFDLALPVAEAFDRLRPLAVVGDDEFIDDVTTDEAGRVSGATITWSKAGNRQQKSWTNTSLGTLRLEPGRLTAEVNSARRADRLVREVIRRTGKGRATVVSRTVVDFERELQAREKKRSRGKRRARSDREADRPPEFRELEAGLRRQYALEWLDLRVPALGNRTPRQAVRTRRGRERVEALMATFERHARDSGNDDREVFAAMRRELRLDAPMK